MKIEERVRLCQLIDKMKTQEEYSKKLGLENKSRLHKQIIFLKKERGKEI